MSRGPALPDLQALTVLDDRLRGVARDPGAVRTALRRARRELAAACREGDRRAELRLLGYVGNAQRLLGETTEAVAALAAGRLLAEELGDRRAGVAALVRLGDAWRCDGRADLGEPHLRRAVAEAREAAPGLLDFALHHLGKCLLDLDRREEGRACLAKALELRQAKDDPDLVASTEAALRLLAATE